MIRWITGLSLRLRFLIVILAVVLMLFGIAQLRSMPLDVYPEFDPPMVEVQTEALGLSAVEMEALITVPLEADLLNGVAWLDQIYSESVAGMSSILLIFEPGTDPIRARQMVQERLTQTFALPNVSSPPTMLQPLSTTSRVMIVGLSSEEISLTDLGVLARWNIKPRLMGVPGVANVAIWGHRDRQLQVLVDPEALAAHDISINQIIETTGESLWVSPLSYLESSSPGTAGWIDTPNQRLSIQHELPISSAEDLENIAVANTGGLLLGDVATVVEDHQPLIGDAALNETPGLLLVIEKFPGANTLEVTQGVETALAAMAPGLQGVEMDTTVYRPANYIETVIGNLRTAVITASILVILVLLAFYFNWRTALITLITIPLSVVVALFVLYLRGETFNVMILAGLIIALGILVDDAIIDVDNISRRLRQRRQNGSELEAMEIVTEAVYEMRRPLMFATLVVLLTVVPLYFIPGLTGSFFQPLVVSYILALVASMVVALLVTPALSMTLLSEEGRAVRRSPLRERMKGGYLSLLKWLMAKPTLALGVTTILIIIGAVLYPMMRTDLVPTFKQAHLLIDWEAAPGTSRQEMNRMATLASREIGALPGVQNVGNHVGRAITGDSVVGINSGQIWVSIAPDADYDTTLNAVRGVIEGYPGMSGVVQNYRPERTAEALTGTDHDLIVRIYGNDLGILSNIADDVRGEISDVFGIEAISQEPFVEEPQIEIEVNMAAAEQFQIKPGDVRRQATTLLSGLRVGSLYEDNKVFDVVVWGTPEVRNSLSAIHELQINTPEGLVRLGDLAEVRIVPTPVVIRRDVVSRFVDIAIDTSGRDLAAVKADIQNNLQNVPFPLEYHAEVLSPSLNGQGSAQLMTSIIITAALGIFLLMQAAFDSWRLALLSTLTLPLALSGGVLVAFASGGLLELGSLFGFLAVLGVAVRNLIVSVKHMQLLERQEQTGRNSALTLRGAQERFTPILMTSLITAVALLPLLLGGDRAGYEILRPMAIVMLGGLTTSALLNLFIIPTLYLHFGSSPAPETKQPAVPVASGIGASD